MGGRHRRASSSVTTTTTRDVIGKRRGGDGDGDEDESTGLGLGLSDHRGHEINASSSSFEQDQDQQESTQIDSTFSYGYGLDPEHHVDDEHDDQGSDHLSFSPETLMDHLISGMHGRRDLIKERRLGPKASSASSSGAGSNDGARSGWKVFHDTGGTSSGLGDDDLVAGHIVGLPPTTTTHPVLSQTLSEYLLLLYTILPLNLVLFLSDPARYLDDPETGIECPYEAPGGWRDVWKQGELGRILSVSAFKLLISYLSRG